MAILIEDGTIIAGANSYVTAAYLETYAGSMGETFTIDAEVLINKSALYVESLNHKGRKLTKAQSMQYPRSGVVIDGFAVLTTEIPTLLKTLQCEVAIAINAGNDPLSTIDRAVKREKVGPIEIEYADNAAPFAYNRRITALERQLVGGVDGGTFEVTRG